MLKVGVTGGIGSGKTTICKIFESLGIPVYYADMEARRLIQEHPVLVEGYRKLFGEKAFEYGKLNRSHVAKMIFHDPELILKVNALVHPVVREDFFQWSRRQNAPYVIEEAAVLLEGGGNHLLDKIILVSAPENVRIARVVRRDGMSEEQVLKRMKYQWNDDKKRLFCNFEITADDNHLVVPQVLKIHFELLQIWDC